MNRVEPILLLSNLRVNLANGDAIVEGVDLELGPGEILGLVGESGSGKTTTALAILGYAGAGAEIVSADLCIARNPLHSRSAFRGARGRLVTYVSQNPATVLNPSLRIEQVIADMIRAHRKPNVGNASVAKLLTTVGLPSSRDFARRYPHQLSGGQQQRVCIAVALASEPAVVVLDEPTTGLDVVTQALILEELLRLRDERSVSMVYVTHDLAVVAQIADRIAVMYAGRVVEQGPTNELLRRPRHPYTRGLLASIPDHVRPRTLQPMGGIAVGVGDRPAGCAFAPRCPHRVAACENMPALEVIKPGHSVRCVEWPRIPMLELARLELVERPPSRHSTPALLVEKLRAEYHLRGETIVAAKDISFRLDVAACVALVGESGSGKTTIGRTIAGLHPASGGRISLAGEPLAPLARQRSTEQRRRLQIVFQDPTSALNPRHTVRWTITRPARMLRGLDKREAEVEVAGLLDSVRLPSRLAERYPAELSGGERQRVAIARALAAKPEVIICDEVTSALDVSVQAAILDLLADLRTSLGVSLLFITHDLGVVASIADHILVLNEGSVCEEGPVGRILDAPAHPYTQRMLQAAPSLAVAVDAWEADAAGNGPGPSVQMSEGA